MPIRPAPPPETLDTTFTWALMLEAGMGPLELFGHLPPREPQNEAWYREERVGELGWLLNETTMMLGMISISREDVAVDLDWGASPRRFSGPWLANKASHPALGPKLPVVRERKRLRATLVPLHRLVAGEVLIHLRVIFQRSASW